MSEVIIGIDLGTTNSEVAVVQDGQVRILEVEGSRLFPSVVGLSEDGQLLVGQAARNQYVLYPERTIKSVKRRMGEDVQLSLGEQTYTPQEISAMILGRLKQAAEQSLGLPVNKAVITVPAYFSDAQRQATRDAGEIAGLEVVRIINEPTAAALAYEAAESNHKTIMVYDLGGGTFDVSIVRFAEDVVEVLSSHGNNHLGGDDFDQRILEHSIAHIKNKHNADPSFKPQAMARLVRAAETAKKTLSDAPYARIEEEYLLESPEGPVNLDLELSRVDYEDMIEDLVKETLEAAHIALDGAKLTVADLDEILLVGGATRTPMIQERLEQDLGLQPRAEMDPDLCVAMGAAIQGAMIGGTRVANVLLDVTPYTFGTSAIGFLNGVTYPYSFVPIIRKNTPIPVTKSEGFQTIADNQDTIEVRVYQGEDPDALNNTQIGMFLVEGLGKFPAGNPVVMTFALDVNGLLHVTCMEKETGLQKSITIEHATARMDTQQMDSARERLQALISGDADGDSSHARRDVTQAQALIEKAERLMEKASPEDAEDLVDGIETIRDAIQSEDWEALHLAVDDLTDLIFYLES